MRLTRGKVMRQQREREREAAICSFFLCQSQLLFEFFFLLFTLCVFWPQTEAERESSLRYKRPLRAVAKFPLSVLLPNGKKLALGNLTQTAIFALICSGRLPGAFGETGLSISSSACCPPGDAPQVASLTCHKPIYGNSVAVLNGSLSFNFF